MRFLLLTGLSGAGKTSATRYLEDMGVFCVDNLPPMMMLKLMEACQSTAMHCPLVAFAVKNGTKLMKKVRKRVYLRRGRKAQ